jgi:hypothetical protein
LRFVHNSHEIADKKGEAVVFNGTPEKIVEALVKNPVHFDDGGPGVIRTPDQQIMSLAL